MKKFQFPSSALAFLALVVFATSPSVAQNWSHPCGAGDAPAKTSTSSHNCGPTGLLITWMWDRWALLIFCR